MKLVCACNKICEETVRDVIRKGATNVQAIAESCSAGRDCGTCHKDLERIVQQVTQPVMARQTRFYLRSFARLFRAV